jgi:hypothetical protein
MNEHEAQRIAAAMHVLRPDWPTASILTMIRKNLIDRPRRDVTVALSWIACEANSHTPARVLESGPWWIAVGVDGTTTNRPGKVDKANRCGICSESRERCGRIWAGDHDFEAPGPKPSTDVPRVVAALKDELTPIAPRTEPTGLDALAERRPELIEAAAKIAALNPGLTTEPMVPQVAAEGEERVDG